MSEYDVRAVAASAVLPLQRALLDRHHPEVEPIPDDDWSQHFGAFFGDTLVGAASIHREAMPDGLEEGVWRLAGVAVDYGQRGRGVGALLVGRCLEHAAAHAATAVWCIAPAGVFGFFEKHGFQRTGEAIDGGYRGPQYMLFADFADRSRSWAV